MYPCGVPNILFSNESSYSKKIKGLEVASKSKIINSPEWLWKVSYYDDYGRVVNQSSTNHLQGKDVVTNSYSFVGELESSTRVHTPKTGTATTIVTKNEYDHVGRVIASKEKIGSQAEVTLTKNDYNEIGQLKSTSVGKAGTETAFINTSTFSYNERGWLTSSSSPKFSQQLKYQDGSSPQWNGNISQQLWGDDVTLPNTFSYSYDKLNRLLSGVSTPVGTSSMSEVMTYDDMGNIKTLKRDALAPTVYAYNGNKLTGLTGGLTGSYTYDGNGNATKDRTGMLFSYNYLNLPQSASKTGTSVTYLYDATGNKLQKKSTVGAVNASRDYINGIEYNGTDIDLIHNSVGYALKSGTNYVYHYNLTDHLGNVRATLKRGSTATAVDVTQRDNYYPFGKQKVVAGGNNNYLYNGKEIQGELGGQYDYGARFYDAEIGRWNVVDPLADEFEHVSPYNYGINNPILMVDPDGMAADTTLLEMVDVYASKAWNYLTSYSFIKSSSDFVSGGQTSQMEHSLELYRTKGYKEYIYDQIGAAHRDNMYSMMSGGYQARSSRAKIRLGKKVPALRAAYVAEVEGLSSLASKMRAAGKSSEEIAKVLHGLRRELGVKYKSLTPDNLLQQIYQRNIQKYGDKLGPSIEYLRNVKGKSWDDIIESATRTGGKDLGL